MSREAVRQLLKNKLSLDPQQLREWMEELSKRWHTSIAEVEEIARELGASFAPAEEPLETVQPAATPPEASVRPPETVAPPVPAPPAPPPPEQAPAASPAQPAHATAVTAASGPRGWAGGEPRLRIDWGLGLRVGLELTPEFHLICPGFRDPVVAFPPDKRLDCDDWEESPLPRQQDEAHWSFFEPVRLTREGVYRLELHAVLIEAATGEPRCFRGEVSVTVTDPKHRSGPKLKIRAAGASVINMPGHDLSGVGSIEVEGEDNAVIQIKGPRGGQEPSGTEGAFVVELPLKPDRELQQLMPTLSSRGPRQAMDAATLALPDGRRVLLLARRRVLLGRQQASDVVLRLEPLDEDRSTLSRLVSRKHLSLELSPDGLVVTDLNSALGSYLNNEPLRQPTVVPQSNEGRPHVLDVGGILSLELSAHQDPTWRPLPQCAELIRAQYRRALGGSPPQSWDFARAAGIDAVRLTRRRDLPLRRYVDELHRNLPVDLVHDVDRLVHTMDLVDELSDLEQYVLVFRTATIGGAESDPIYLAHAGLSPSHARVFHLDGFFWLEHLHQHGTTHVEGRQLAPHELAPLAAGTRLRFGQLEVTFEEHGRIKLPVSDS